MNLEPLRQGDIIDIVAPASRCTTKELRDAVQALRKMGFKPRVPKNIFGKTDMVANTDHERAAQLWRALNAKDSKMIWCVRGGYGALRLMPEIEKWPRPKQGKIVLGYSDITTLHAHFNCKWGWPTLHGPLLDRFGRGVMSSGEKRQLFGLLKGEQTITVFEKMQAMNRAARKTAIVPSKILGGNLTVLQSSLATGSELKPKGAILFLEDRLSQFLRETQP